MATTVQTVGAGARARLVMDAVAWRDLDADERRAAGRVLAGFGVTWAKIRNEAGDTIAHRSCPLSLADACSARKRLADERCFHAVKVAPVHTHAHLAAVILGGRRVVMGAGSPLHTAYDAETRGTPVAVVVRGEVTPYGEAVYGHTDAELLAAPLLARECAAVGGAQ